MDYKTFVDKLNSIDKKDHFSDCNYDCGDFESDFKLFIEENIFYHEYSVLGIDIYEYSQFDINRQSLIPFVFDLIYTDSIRFAIENERSIFKGYSFEEKFIPTGDGGFQIFDQPLQAIVFITIFHTILHTYNASRFYPRLREYIGPVLLRSCITYDKIFNYNSNYYGPAIISNARILSKDKLNRFLIDDNSYKWFLKKINGIENITEITGENIIPFVSRDETSYKTTFFPMLESKSATSIDPLFSKFKNCHIQKIGTIISKKDKISIYNIEMQVYVHLKDEIIETESKGMIVTIGNLNTAGITE